MLTHLAEAISLEWVWLKSQLAIGLGELYHATQTLFVRVTIFEDTKRKVVRKRARHYGRVIR